MEKASAFNVTQSKAVLAAFPGHPEDWDSPLCCSVLSAVQTYQRASSDAGTKNYK